MAEQKKRLSLSNVRSDAKDLIWSHRYRLALGMLLMIINRLVGLVLPASSKYLIDDVIIKHRSDLLVPLALAAGGSTLVQALSSFALTQVLGVAAQRAITEMRKSVQEHVARLPTRYFDSTQAGILISRIMTDAEGIRNLVGTGLVQLIGGLVTASIALVVLFYLNWRLTSITLLALAIFGGMMALAFKRLRPIFRERGEINAQVTGRLGESLGGIRIVKAYTAEKREELSFTRGAHRLFRNIAKSITGVSAISSFSSVVIGAVAVVMIRIDGKDLQAVRLRDYRKHLGVVLQDNFLFDGTILDNIRFSNPEANLEKIKAVCKIANADEFIEKFPNGYETIVGERGVKLSG